MCVLDSRSPVRARRSGWVSLSVRAHTCVCERVVLRISNHTVSGGNGHDRCATSAPDQSGGHSSQKRQRVDIVTQDTMTEKSRCQCRTLADAYAAYNLTHLDQYDSNVGL